MVMEQGKKDKYLCTRPILAGKLMARGYYGEQIINPWYPGRAAWLFEVDEPLKAFVDNYYMEITGQPCPALNRKEVQ